MTVDGEFDYLIVGSGAGGGPLAANLARAGQRVLLLEAGGVDGGYNYKVPVFNALASEDPTTKWDFYVRHYSDQAQQQRDPKLVTDPALVGDRPGVLYPRAGTLGGCTAHNAMLMIYPHNADWDYVAELTGDPTWHSSNMWKYFQRLERCRYRWFERILDCIFRTSFSRHGFRGWLTTSTASPLLALKDKTLLKVVERSALEAFEEEDHKLERLFMVPFTKLDPNDWRLVRKSAEGVRTPPLSVRKGRRVGPREYIRRVQREMPDKLVVKTHAFVTRVLFDDEQRAIGVEYVEGESLYRADPRAPAADAGEPPERHQVMARREVILAGGAYNTPQLLMLSGVGPADELRKHGIEPRVDLPGVGRNLQDRYEVSVVNRMKGNFTILEKAKLEVGDEYFKEWELGKGPYTSNGATIAIIKRSQKSRPLPDLFIFGFATDFQGYFPGYSEKARETKDMFSWAILKAHTHNHAGRVTLRSADPFDVPEINFHYFEEGQDPDGQDLDSVVEAVQFVRRMTARYSDLQAEEVAPGADVQTPEQIAQWVKDRAWGHHASCSCKIGRDDDELAVLDSRFRVRGTKGLRVVDASVFPRIPGFFIVSSIFMISEKATDVILEDAGVRQ